MPFRRFLTSIVVAVLASTAHAEEQDFPGYEFASCAGLLAQLGEDWEVEFRRLPTISKPATRPELIRRQVLKTYVHAIEDRRVAGAVGVLNEVIESAGISQKDKPEDISQALYETIYDEIDEGFNPSKELMRTILGVPGERMLPAFGFGRPQYGKLHALTERPHLAELLKFPGYSDWNARGRLLGYLRMGNRIRNLSQLRIEFFHVLLREIPLTRPADDLGKEAADLYYLAMENRDVEGMLISEGGERREFFERVQDLCESGQLPLFMVEELRRHREFLDEFELMIDPLYQEFVRVLEESIE